MGKKSKPGLKTNSRESRLRLVPEQDPALAPISDEELKSLLTVRAAKTAAKRRAQAQQLHPSVSPSSKLDTAKSSSPSELAQQIMAQQTVKSTDLAAKQKRLLAKLSSSAPPKD